MIDPQIENARKVMSALTASHIDVQFDASTLANPAKLIRVKVLHYWLDLLTPEGGVDFAELRGRAVFATMNEMLVPVVGRDDLIALKEVAASKPDCDAKHKQFEAFAVARLMAWRCPRSHTVRDVGNGSSNWQSFCVDFLPPRPSTLLQFAM